MRAGAVINADQVTHHAHYDRKVDLHAPQAPPPERSPDEGGGGGSHDEAAAHQTLLCAPLLSDTGTRLGVLQAAGKVGAAEGFDSDDELLLRLAAECIASAVQNAHVHAATASFASSLMRLCRDLFSQPTPASVLTQFAGWAQTIVGSAQVHSALADALASAAEDGDDGDGSSDCSGEDGGSGGGGGCGGGAPRTPPLLPVGDGPRSTHAAAVARVLSGGGAIALDADGTTRTPSAPPPAELMREGGTLLLPLLSSAGRVLAVLQARRPTPAAPFTATDLQRLAPAVSLASLALERSSDEAEERASMREVARLATDGSALQQMVGKGARD